MAHMLVLGPTECGKSTAVRELLRKPRANGKKVLVYARRDIDAWRTCADAVVSDRQHFLDILARPGTRSCIVVLDDAGRTVGRTDSDLIATAAEGRHDGHAMIYIAQAATMLNKDLRRNCTQLLMFKQAEEDCEVLAREFIQPALRSGTGLAQFEYMFCKKGFGPVRRGRVKL